MKEGFGDSSYSALAIAVLSSTETFASAFLTWITTKTMNLNVTKGEGSEEDNWSFVCHAARAILHALYLARKGGSRYSGDPAGQVWHILKCVQLQNELVEKGFYHHEIVQKVLAQHLKNDAVLKSVHDKFVIEINEKLKTFNTRLQKVEKK